MRELKFIQCCPSDIYYTWQVNLWLESLREIGQSDKQLILSLLLKEEKIGINGNKLKIYIQKLSFITMLMKVI